ncbi:hypothetical protein KC19_9G152100 [Ceratodon purpureus]|uniref:Nucleotide-diphospho-sugar transferase domain-containing protein n=2 Tax=Ceratodon purpureus TaxID=3225 RepID=A0A8T0H032_CERPU|nr:hypothetical protein KC19_9G152100 [Ceratodon purpureus]
MKFLVRWHMLKSSWLERVNMAPIKHGMRIFYMTTMVVSLVLCLPYMLGRNPSVEQLMSGLSKLSIIRGAAEDPKFTIPSNFQKEVRLEDVLAQASMPDKTVIITSLNEAWAANNSMIDIFLEGFHSGENITHLLRHLVIVCVDQKAYDRCVQLHPHCFQMKTSGIDFTAEKIFMTADFLKMMWRRIEFLGEVLQLGYSFIFSDGDILWLRDPFAVFSKNMDVQISTDQYRGRPFDVRNQSPNSGFLYVRSNNRTIEMYKYWYEARLRNPGKNDQHVLKAILQEQDFGSQVGVKVQFFETLYFSGFCKVSQDMRKVVTMHSNCCVGLENKLNDLRLSLDDWRLYKNTSHPVNEGNITQAPQRNLWRAPSACKNSFERLAPWAL